MVNESVESEDSCDEEYTLLVEEVVQAEPDEMGAESPDLPLPMSEDPKDSIENADDEIVEATVVDDDGDSNNFRLPETNVCSPSTVCQEVEVEEPSQPEHINSSAKIDSVTECEPSDSLDRRQLEADSEEALRLLTENKVVESGTLCDAIIVPGTKEMREKNSEVRLNGVVPSIYDSAVHSNCETASQASSPIVGENHSPSMIAKEGVENVPNNRKRSSNCSGLNGRVTDIHLVSDVKKRRIPNASGERIHSINGNISNIDHEYASPLCPEVSTSTPSQEESITAKSDSSEKKGGPKKNIARKHTSSPHGYLKAVKDVKNIVLLEMNKTEQNLSNGFSPLATLEDQPCDKSARDQGTNTDPQHKVNFSVDDLSDNTIETIYQTMRNNLTRRQLEEIVLQKICETISDSEEIGELKRQVYELQQAENHRKSVCFNLEKQLHQLKGVCQSFMEKANAVKRDGRTPTPTMITRSVGLQVALDTNNPVSKSTNNATPSVTHVVKSVPVKSPLRSDVKKVGASSSTGTAMTARANTTNRASVDDKRAVERPSSSTLEEVSTIIDLTDKDDREEESLSTRRLPAQPPKLVPSSTRVVSSIGNVGPKQVMIRPVYRHEFSGTKLKTFNDRPALTQLPPKPDLTIAKKSDEKDRGVSLSWNMQLNKNCGKIAKYQIYAFQQTNNPGGHDPWKLVGEVDALPLPMECTLTQFFAGHRYHFKVRAVDEHHRMGPFSDQKMISL